MPSDSHPRRNMRSRTMLTMFVGLLVMFFINKQTTAQVELTFASIGKIVKVGTMIFKGVNGVLSSDKTKENVEFILHKVKHLSIQLGSLETHMNTKLNAALDTLLNDIEITIDLQNQKAKLLHNFHSVDHFYDDSLKYVFGGPYANITLVKFTERVLYDPDNLIKLLIQMHDIFNSGTHYHLNPGFLSLVIEKTTQNLSTDCKRYVSPQQLMYYIYVQLIIAELKGLAILKNVYTTKWLLSEKFYNYAPEMNDSKVSFEKRVREYHRIFTKNMALLPRHLRRCHVITPERDVDFLEMKNFSRMMVLDKNYDVNRFCERCPEDSQLDRISYITRTRISNCIELGSFPKVCRAEPGSHREYFWLKNSEDTYFGHYKSCAKETFIKGNNIVRPGVTVYTTNIVTCNLCLCSVYQNRGQSHDKPENWIISVMEQISNIWNNMVVTGVKFVMWGNAIHLQIQQAKFTQSGMISSDVEWKKPDTQYHKNGTIGKYTFMANCRLNSTMKTIYIDDLIVPKGSVITGIKFARVGDEALRLLVHATEFDFETGELNPSASFWCKSTTCNNELPTSNYKRQRIEIKMDQSDDPTRGIAFNYDPESNKMIKFTHTDVYKDAGQTTIPFFDAQPLQARPVFPLSGVGLYYKGAEGFGGYITPRIYTLDITNYMKIPQKYKEDAYDKYKY